MTIQKTHRDGWATAMAPVLVATPAKEKHVSFAEKQREANQLRADVDAHIAAGGAFEILAGYASAVVRA
ncbi:hypothetical protein LQE85_01570 [Stenotrophomonas rhizophila]|uniref:hypothetical protein n=1 Tax=Stenotrophomonas rhizophila TaxID=216778 RepID=UPI00201D0925|nr:hypothetical protein [Stenotrophomonas rhizophila]UQY87954.1 hypothetical protein LQE85_01570 [Stenotrophomonas rhizophila]